MDLLMELMDAPTAQDMTNNRPAAASEKASVQAANQDLTPAPGFITGGAADDGNGTLIGRSLLAGRSVLQDPLAKVSRGGSGERAQCVDGPSVQCSQDVTIDAAHR